MGSFVLKPCCIATLLTLALTMIAKGSFDNNDQHHFAKHAPPWCQVPPFAHTVLGGALSFLMVFRTNTAYSRWWEARLMWGQITVACRSLGAHSAALMATDSARRAVASELILFAIALKNHLRGEKTMSAEAAAPEALRVTVDKGGAASSFAGLISAPNPPMAVICALSKTVRAGLRRDDDALVGPAYLFVSEELRALTGAATACERIKNSPMPFGYVAALRFFLIVWLFTLPTTMIGPFGWFATPAVACISFLFLNLEQVAIEIEQPFGHDANDLPLEEYCSGIERILLGLLSATEPGATSSQAH